VRFHKEQREDLPVTGLGLISELEGQYTVLEDIWKGNKTAFLNSDVANILYGRAILLAPEDFREPFVVLLLVGDTISVINIALLAKG
jgi:hypothetical protein